MTPTQRSIAVMRERGYYAEVVERWIPYIKQRKDFAGFIDVLCLGDDVVGVQCTSDSNLAARITKITEHENLPVVRRAGIRILAHGWKKVGGRWRLREVDLS